MGLFKKNYDINSLDYYLLKSEDFGYYYKSADSIDLEYYKKLFGNEKALGYSLLEIAKNKFSINESLGVMISVYNDLVKEGTDKEINLYIKIVSFLNQNININDNFIWDIKYYQYLSIAFNDKQLIFLNIFDLVTLFDTINFFIQKVKWYKYHSHSPDMK